MNSAVFVADMEAVYTERGMWGSVLRELREGGENFQEYEDILMCPVGYVLVLFAAHLLSQVQLLILDAVRGLGMLQVSGGEK